NPRLVSRGGAEVDHVAIEHDVVLALEAKLAMIAAGGDRTSREQMLVAHDLGADEAALDIGVDLAGCQLRRRVTRNRPGPTLVLPDREERDVAEQIVAGADHAIQPRLLEP